MNIQHNEQDAQDPQQPVRFEAQGRVALITLNRPHALNAIDGALWRGLGEAFERFKNDDALWVAVITGAGERAFCAGADLKAVARGELVRQADGTKQGFAGIVRQRCDKPVIAAVNGLAFGGGMEIVLWCDMAVAAAHARFALPEVRRGLMAAGGGLLRLPRQVPPKVAAHFLFTGAEMDAAQALRWGLVNAVVPATGLRSAAMTLAERVCESAPLAVRASKRVMREALALPADSDAAWAISDQAAAANRATEDAKEGPLAFAEKRAARWRGA